MGEPSHDEVKGMVPPERALEQVSVEEAWQLLNTLSSQVVGKQTELQVCSVAKTTRARTRALHAVGICCVTTLACCRC